MLPHPALPAGLVADPVLVSFTRTAIIPIVTIRCNRNCAGTCPAPGPLAARAPTCLIPVPVPPGASSGIGEAIAWRLAEAGASMVITGRRVERLQKLADDLTGRYPAVRVLPLTLDMTDLAAIKALPGSLPADFQQVGYGRAPPRVPVAKHQR